MKTTQLLLFNFKQNKRPILMTYKVSTEKVEDINKTISIV